MALKHLQGYLLIYCVSFILHRMPHRPDLGLSYNGQPSVYVQEMKQDNRIKSSPRSLRNDKMRNEPTHRPSALPQAADELSHESTLQAELTQPREPTSLLFVVDNTRFPAIPQFWNLPDRLPYFWIHPGTRDAAHQHLYPAPGNWSSPRCSLRLFTL
jgi:hypothetical protein